jgi:hypothetical protein
LRPGVSTSAPSLRPFFVFAQEAFVTELKPRYLALFLMTLGAMSAVGCAADDETATADENDLTSVTARERKMTFDGYVYVDPAMSDAGILNVINRQTKSAFGAIRTAEISANTRELALEDAASFKKESVIVVNPASPNTKRTLMRVRYRYTDRALVPIAMAKRGATSLALLAGDYQAQSKRVLKECTDNTAHDQEFESAIWYVFNPSLDQCKLAIEAEQTALDADRKVLSDQATQVTTSEVARLYIPITIQFESTSTTTKKTYPEYDRLWNGGVQPGKVVVSMISGVMADWAAGEKPETIKDIGYTMYFQQNAELLKTRPTLKIVDAEGADLSTFTVNGKTVSGATWADLSHWELDGTGWPSNITTAADRLALRKAVATKLVHRWIRWEAPVSVKIGGAAAKDVTVQINTYYGAETDETPHRKALRGSDVVIYNGHSYIGSGPLDPNSERFVGATRRNRAGGATDETRCWTSP